MNRSDFRFLFRLRVRTYEIDAQQVVSQSRYLDYADAALAGYWRALALPHSQALTSFGGDLFLRKAEFDYLKPAHHDDVLEIGVCCQRAGPSLLQFTVAVFRQDELLVKAELLQGYANAQTRAPMPVPQEVREMLSAYEAGQPMVTVRLGLWGELGVDAQTIRSEVFIAEQRIPAEMEWDEADAACLHAVAYNHLGMPLATGRLMEHVPGVAKIGRMAVRRVLRGSGVGRSVLDALMQAARERGYREAVLHAQASAASFYVRAGFVSRGPSFDEVGIAHIEMVKTL